MDGHGAAAEIQRHEGPASNRLFASIGDNREAIGVLRRRGGPTARYEGSSCATIGFDDSKRLFLQTKCPLNMLFGYMRFTLLPLCFVPTLFGQTQFYAGALTGIATLSADGKTNIASSDAGASSYKPENGAIVSLFGGVHLNDYVSLQGNFTGNRNNLVLSSFRGTDLAYEQKRRSSMRSFSGDVAVYFRGRGSWVRPFLSVGVGGTNFKSETVELTYLRGAITPPPNEFSETMATFRSAVGIDVALKRGWAFRFSFVEPIQKNPISPRLSPAGQRNLASFQNLFGFVKTFGPSR
jgi:hypothetical protein